MASEGVPIELQSLHHGQRFTLHGCNSTSDSSDDSDDDYEEKDAGDIQDHPSVHDIVAKCSTFAGMEITGCFEGDKIKPGQRVVRGIDWEKNNDDDGGNGNVGTVVEILNNAKEVRVQWDSQEDAHHDEDKFKYRTGLDRKYDLRLFDNAQTGVYHKYFACDGCNESPIKGMRWRCLYCEDYDLCTDCYMWDEHDLDHAFERHQGMKTKSVNVGMRVDLDFEVASGIFCNTNVISRKDPEIKGEVTNMADHIVMIYNCDAKVVWLGESLTKRYRVGREGKVDLKFVVPTEMPYIEDHLQEISKDNASVGLRVVKKSDNGHSIVGTITSIKKDAGAGKHERKRGRRRQNHRQSRVLPQNIAIEDGSKRQSSDETEYFFISVRWDNGETEELDSSKGDILLFDNSQIGIIQGAFCDECGNNKRIKGIRWKCSTCPDYDLCTPCYMSGNDDHTDHRFLRITEPTKRTILDTPRNARDLKRQKALGIFKGAKVQLLEDERGPVGRVEGICHYRINNYTCIVVVDTENGEEYKGQITDFRCEEDEDSFEYYPTHLPDYGKGIQGYVTVTDKDTNAEIDVELWYQKDIPKSTSEVQYSLYLIFAHKVAKESDNNEDGFRPLKDVKKFARKHHVPCQLAAEKILFVSEVVVIHKETDYDTIQKLVKLGVRKFVRGDSDEDEDEQTYFLRMSHYLSGRVPLPVFISLRNGVLHSDNALIAASYHKIPVICFKNNAKDVYVLTMRRDEVYYEYRSVEGMEHKLDLKSPWKVSTSCKKDYFVGCYRHDNVDDEITKLSDLGSDLENLDALVCSLLIGVFMNRNSESENDIFGYNTRVYPNALSMYLLKTGKWKIPKNAITASFNYQSIEYIFEEKMTKYFKEGLWKELELKTKSAYTAPKWKERENEDSSNKDTDEVDGRRDGYLNVKISGLFGLIFLALLRKKYYDGAKQLIETGCVRITHLLIGCVILQEAADDWQTSQLEKDKLLRMKTLCTQQALRITSCIHEADTKPEKKRAKNEEKDAEQVGHQINHAGRLLLNHGYLSDAIKTQNSVYLNDEIVKKVISQMWYNSESISLQRGLLFLFFTVFHFLLLPVLMITMENRPLQWLYRQYKVPAMKVLLNAFGWVAVLTAFAYMLLFDFTDGISKVDWFLIGWMASFFLDESKQIVISLRRRKFREYVNDWWNRLDWMLMGVYLGGMLLKLGEGEKYHNASKTLLVLTFILMCIRSLNMLMISEIIGAKLVMIKKMFMDTFAFLTIMTVVSGCYSVSYYAILFTDNSDLSFTEIERIIRNGFWILFGELSLEYDRLREPDCTFNKTLYKSGVMDRCPSEWGLFLAPYLKALYAVIAIILLLNLLIAMYSHTFEEVHEKSKFYWSQLQTDFLEEYSVKSIFPVHFQLLALPVCLVHFIFWCPFHFLCPSCGGDDFSDTESDYDEYFRDEDDDDEFNKSPMFVRVFLYDTNFDLQLKRTRDAEGQAALKASGNLEVTDEDKFTLLQSKIKRQKQTIKEIHDMTSKILSEIREIKRDKKPLSVSDSTSSDESDENYDSDDI
ncbi:uncharacterized protein LOC133180401 [Saccostrea echinata]|uniref:uncharacterized protein LOC133180401 n=1 Tax=Saccostrea echinata TaxID=191078 RepID=UPI002A7F2B70|nr:uncharacterized protein LOC133180401 [Saccostrea echinata]